MLILQYVMLGTVVLSSYCPKREFLHMRKVPLLFVFFFFFLTLFMDGWQHEEGHI